MDKQQQQNAMLKLATVRLAINHVLRSRAMQKQAEGDVPGYGYFAEPGSPAPYLPHPAVHNMTVNPKGSLSNNWWYDEAQGQPRNRWNWTWDGREEEIPLGVLDSLNRRTWGPRPHDPGEEVPADDYPRITKFGPSEGNIEDYYKAFQKNPAFKQKYPEPIKPKSVQQAEDDQSWRDFFGDWQPEPAKK